MLIVRASQLPFAGQGLWAAKDFRRREIICKYEGEQVTWKECQRRNMAQVGYGSYYLYINERKCVDAQHTPWAIGRYANDAAGLNRIKKLRNNARYEIIKGDPYIMASRNIRKGEEIFVSYGKSYWNIMSKQIGN